MNDLGVEVPRRLWLLWVPAVLCLVAAGLLGGASGFGMDASRWIPLVALLAVAFVVLAVATFGAGRETRQASRVAVEERGYGRWEIAMSWRLHRLQIACAGILAAGQLLIIGLGNPHWLNWLILASAAVNLTVVGRSAVLRRRRERRQAA
ncbi:MAG TPA: hypothetical protein VGE77_00690 [Nocardioides sp.]